MITSKRRWIRGRKIVFRLGESIDHNVKRKYCVHPPKIGQVTDAAFDAQTLILMRDCPIDVANYYAGWAGFWGW